MNAEHVLFATAPRGLEPLLAKELEAIGLDGVEQQRGGVQFRSDLVGGYRACLWSRLANRVLLKIATFEAADDNDLYAATRALNWSDHLGPEQTMAVDFTGIRAAIQHGLFAAQRIKDAVCDCLRESHGERPSVDLQTPDVRINAHMHGQTVTLAIDLSGDSLHRRGYREPGTRAPLKENLAAAMLYRGQWPEIAAAGGAFCDPMTGSGTLAIEAAWMAGDVAPGLLRTRFGFLGWRGHDDGAWKTLIDEAIERQEAGLCGLPPIQAFDSDDRAVRIARANAERAGLGDRIHVQTMELADVHPPSGSHAGLIAINPPYGERLGAAHELVPLYARLGETLKHGFPGWHAIVLNGSDCELGLKPERTWQMENGPIQCRLERFELTRRADVTAALPADDLVNRIAKNRRRLASWLKRNNITCYRIYDADIPEYALAVDIYGTTQGQWLHVQEYAAPKGVDPRAAQTRLRAALAALPKALDIDPKRVVFKVRQRQRGDDQYQRLATRQEFLTVQEGAVDIRVNLTDYLDTGLFLDHRPVRQWLHEHADGKRLLNLFCYTGVATVHAAAGGARNTTSVDLSNTYLDWLRRNLALNGLDTPQQRLIREDARAWLASCGERFELIFLDPPSFSNSKRMDSALDLQRDHVDLIRNAMRCLSRDGVLIFSTNLRRFRLDPALESEFAFDDRTPWSIPKDFARNKKIHRCWFVRHTDSGDMA